MFNIFINCYFTDTNFIIIFCLSKSIANAAYNTFWYNAKPNESRILLILILRSQKQLTITIGKFNNLSLEVFANILKASASYVSVLLAMS
ncbi:hypothetical protein PUN28_008219 [Cardiocondyla obscurior]|uniref:Uncharacterized protein n=1 Tax=Cardiocondyla obscurior TaxID=286306 RepID=A0AAW2G2W5_9HYME